MNDITAFTFFAQFNMYWNFHARADTGQVNLGQLRQADLQGLSPQDSSGVAFCTDCLGGCLHQESPHLGPGEKTARVAALTKLAKVQTSVHSQSVIAFHEPLLKTYFQNSSRCHHQVSIIWKETVQGTDPSVDKTSKRIGEAWQVSGKGKTEPPNRVGQSRLLKRMYLLPLPTRWRIQNFALAGHHQLTTS